MTSAPALKPQPRQVARGSPAGKDNTRGVRPCNCPVCFTARSSFTSSAFPCPEVLGPEATEGEIKTSIDRHGMIFLKPIFKGGIGMPVRQSGDTWFA
jgi:hypothetical protein